MVCKNAEVINLQNHEIHFTDGNWKVEFHWKSKRTLHEKAAVATKTTALL